MVMKSFEEILVNYNNAEKKTVDLKQSISIPVPKEYKARYKKIQQERSGEFCEVLRELIIMAIDKTDQKAS